MNDIKITFKNGEHTYWLNNSYDDYSYRGQTFIVKKNNTQIGIYNMDEIRSIEIESYGNRLIQIYNGVNNENN